MINWDYQKALDRINHSMWNQDMETTEYVATLQDALEKQIPQKCTVIPEDDDMVYVRYACPSCEHIIGYGNLKLFGKNQYCPKCGQRLGW